MKYEKEIDDLLRDLFYEDWLSEEEYQEVIHELLKEIRTTKSQLSEALEDGVNNGYSVELQFTLLKHSLDNLT